MTLKKALHFLPVLLLVSGSAMRLAAGQGSVSVGPLPSWSILMKMDFDLTRRVNLQQSGLSSSLREAKPKIRLGDFTTMLPKEADLRLGEPISYIPKGKRTILTPSLRMAKMGKVGMVMAASVTEFMSQTEPIPEGGAQITLIEDKTPELYRAVALDRMNRVIGVRLGVPNGANTFRAWNAKCQNQFGKPSFAWKGDSDGAATEDYDGTTGVMAFAWGWGEKPGDSDPVIGSTVASVSYHTGWSMSLGQVVVTSPPMAILDIVGPELQPYGGFDSLTVWMKPYSAQHKTTVQKAKLSEVSPRHLRKANALAEEVTTLELQVLKVKGEVRQAQDALESRQRDVEAMPRITKTQRADFMQARADLNLREQGLAVMNLSLANARRKLEEARLRRKASKG